MLHKTAALSLIIPAYNEEARLPLALEAATASLPTLARDAEILVVDDGSTDGTRRVVEGCRAPDGVAVRYIGLSENRGKGHAVARGVREARHPHVAFTDADSPYDLRSLAAMLAALDAGRCDIAIGSRDLPDSNENRGYGPLRRLSGRTLSVLTGMAIGLPFRDSQCGLKAFRADVARALFERRTVDGFGFDFEILAAAVHNGLAVERFPVRLTHDDDSRIDIVRDSMRMMADLWNVRRGLRHGTYDLEPPTDGTARARPCPLCAASGASPRAERDGYRMVECRSCGLWYLNPMPSAETLADLYRESYYDSEHADERGYADYGAMADDFRATFAERLKLVHPYVGRGRILDVGAGFGYLADAASRDFRERWVVEMSPEAAGRVSREHRVVLSDWEAADLPEDYFDVVSMQDCLEHLPEPGPALDKIQRVLRPGGAFLAVTPDVGSWLARVQGQNWVSLKFPEHVVLYSERTLRRVLGEAGFEVTTVRPARQYVRADFVAERIVNGHPAVAQRLGGLFRRSGVGRLRLNVPSGSLAVVATKPEA